MIVSGAHVLFFGRLQPPDEWLGVAQQLLGKPPGDSTSEHQLFVSKDRLGAVN